MKVNSKECTELTIDILQAGLVPMIHGDPGIGKSDIVQDIADKFNWHLIDIRLSQCDPTDLNGFPTVRKGQKEMRNESGNTIIKPFIPDIATYIPMDIFPMENTQLPDNKKAFLIFLDELNSASMAVQAASYKLILDRMVGQHKLHPKTFIVGAGNLASNNAIVNRLGTAMQSRLVHLELDVDNKLWLEWANKNLIDPRITAYINSVPGNLHKFKAQHNDKTFACPRTWHFVSKLIKNKSGSLKDMLPLLAGTISEGIAIEFVAHLDLCVNLPTFNEIKLDPKGIGIDKDPALLFAVAHMVAANLTENNLATVMPYITRLPVEFSTTTLKTACGRTPELTKTDEVKDWITTQGFALF